MVAAFFIGIVYGWIAVVQLVFFTCYTVGDEYLLYAAVELSCNSPSHTQWRVAGGFALFVFAVVLPGLVFLGMWRVRDALQDEDSAGHDAAVRQWGFLV